MTLDRITSNPNQMNGQPYIRNMRITVRRVIELLATYLPARFAIGVEDEAPQPQKYKPRR